MKGLKFILVDDNEAFRRVLRDLLVTQYDAEIIAEASNAEEVRRIKKIQSVDIILMDVMMPGESGIDLTGRDEIIRPADVCLLFLHNPFANKICSGLL